MAKPKKPKEPKDPIEDYRYLLRMIEYFTGQLDHPLNDMFPERKARESYQWRIKQFRWQLDKLIRENPDIDFEKILPFPYPPPGSHSSEK